VSLFSPDSQPRFNTRDLASISQEEVLLAAIIWNEWPGSRGIDGRLRLESPAGINGIRITTWEWMHEWSRSLRGGQVFAPLDRCNRTLHRCRHTLCSVNSKFWMVGALHEK
jgi:hypothetical protein